METRQVTKAGHVSTEAGGVEKLREKGERCLNKHKHAGRGDGSGENGEKKCENRINKNMQQGAGIKRDNAVVK